MGRNDGSCGDVTMERCDNDAMMERNDDVTMERWKK